MKHEIISLEQVQLIGIAKEITFCKGEEECPKFWDEYVERIIQPVVFEMKIPDAFHQVSRQATAMWVLLYWIMVSIKKQ